MTKMLNKPDKMRSCGCCPWWRGPSGRRWEERFWRHEWNYEEGPSVDREYEHLEQLADDRVTADFYS